MVDGVGDAETAGEVVTAGGTDAAGGVDIVGAAAGVDSAAGGLDSSGTEGGEDEVGCCTGEEDVLGKAGPPVLTEVGLASEGVTRAPELRNGLRLGRDDVVCGVTAGEL